MDSYEQALNAAMPGAFSSYLPLSSGYQLTEEEKKALKMQQLIATGAALMAGRGNFVNNLGQAMLVGQNQGSEGMQDLRRNKLADAEMQYRNAQIQNQQRTFAAAQAKEAAALAAAQQQGQVRSNIGNVMQGWNARDPSAVMGSLAPTVGNADRMEALRGDEDAMREAAYERAVQLAAAGGDKDTGTMLLNLFNELNPTWSTDPKISVDAGRPNFFTTSNKGRTKRLGETPPPAFDWKDTGGTLEARNKYDPEGILATIRKSVSPDTGARVAQDDRDLKERKRQFNQTQFEVPGTALYPGYGPGNVMAPREKLPKVFAAKEKPEKATETDKPVTRSQWMDDTRADWTAKYPSQYGERPKGAPTLDEYRQQYPFEGKKGDAAVTAPAKAEKKVVRTGTRNGKKVVQYDDGTIEELQ